MKKYLRVVLILVCSVVFVGCMGWLVYHLLDQRMNQEQNENIKEEYVTEAVDTEIDTKDDVEKPEKPSVEEEEALSTAWFGGVEYPTLSSLELPEREIDFAGLEEVCADIYGWIYIPETMIDYPVVQHETKPEYYLRRDLQGKQSTPGCIFTQYYNSKDFQDPNTVIYGHNMHDGTMFADLHVYEDEDFFLEKPYIYIYTKEYTLAYEVFAAYEYSDEHLLLARDYKNSAVYQEYLEMVWQRDGLKDNLNPEISVDTTDRIITLSTCITGKEDGRYLVQAKLIAVEPKE